MVWELIEHLPDCSSIISEKRGFRVTSESESGVEDAESLKRGKVEIIVQKVGD